MAKIKDSNFQYYDVIMENAKLCFKPNFEGRETKNQMTGDIMNQKGKRNFEVVMDDPETNISKRWYDQETGQFMTKKISADDLANEGWNIKIFTPKDDTRSPFRHMRVQVSFDRKPPKIYMSVNGNPEVELDEDTVKDIDDCQIMYADIAFRSHPWENSFGQSGINGYLSEAHFDVAPSSLFGEKYMQ